MPYIPCIDKCFIYTLFEATGADSFPHEPQFETVDLATALQGLVPHVQIEIVEFVLLEQVCSIGAVAPLQQTLGK